MMSATHVHNCVQLGDENDKLKRLIRKVKRQNDELKTKLSAIEERQKVETLLKQYVTTRDTQVQTEIPGLRTFQPSVLSLHHNIERKVVERKPQTDDNGKINKMLVMHNNLMKRYEKELKSNMEHMETITKLSLRINELELKLKESESELHELKVGRRVRDSKRAVSTGRRPRTAAHTASRGGTSTARRAVSPSAQVWLDSSDDSIGVQGLLKELSKTRRERDKLAKDKKKLKDEIKGLDHGFFDEIEDLKYALHRSAKLNQQYEHALRSMCTQFGMPYPISPQSVVT